MTKTKTPFFSLESHGTIGKTLTSQKRGSNTLLRQKPTPTDPKSLAQMYQRWDYQAYTAWWHTLSVADKQTWETNARPYHMTGFAYWMRDRLTNLPDLAGRWHLDNIIGNQVRDSSKNTNHGTVYGASPATGIIDKALLFDHIDDYVEIPDHPTLDITTAITLEAFVKLTTNVYAPLVGKWMAANRRSYLLQYSQINDKIQFALSSDGIAATTAHSATALALDTWYHALATWDGSWMIVYLNGQPGTPVAFAGPIFTSNQPATIGAAGYGWAWAGAVIDEASIINRALAESEIPQRSERRYPL